MKIFITGAAGFLGSHLADRLLYQGHSVVGVDNMSGGFLDNINPKIEFHIADCLDLEKMKLYSKGCNVIFHAACTAHDGFSVFSPYHITNNTFQTTMSVLSAAISNGVSKFIYCSSMARYGEQSTHVFTENMICNPQSPYGWAKYSSEKILAQLASLNDMQHVIVVPHNIIGPRQNFTDPYRNVVSIMINRLLQNKAPIIYGDGEQKRCFSYIDDVVNCLEKIIMLDGLNGEVINVGPDEEFVTLNELTNMLCDITNIHINSMYYTNRPYEVRYASCSADKARALLGYSTQTSLYDALTASIQYIRLRGPAPFQYNNVQLENITPKTPITWKNQVI